MKKRTLVVLSFLICLPPAVLLVGAVWAGEGKPVADATGKAAAPASASAEESKAAAPADGKNAPEEGTVTVNNRGGGVAIDKVELRLTPDRKPYDVLQVTNTFNEPFKIKARVLEVKNAGMPGYSEAATDKLVVAPKIFELAPNETRSVRLVLRKYPEDLEEIYKVSFSPQIAPLAKSDKPKQEGFSFRIETVTTMGAIVFASPKKETGKFGYKREGDIIHYFNAGNVTTRLLREEYCVDKDKKDTCNSYFGKNIFPGMKIDLPVPEEMKGKPFDQTIEINGKFSKISHAAN